MLLVGPLFTESLSPLCQTLTGHCGSQPSHRLALRELPASQETPTGTRESSQGVDPTQSPTKPPHCLSPLRPLRTGTTVPSALTPRARTAGSY